MSTSKDRAHRIGNLAEARKIDDPRISAAARDDQLRLVFFGQPGQFRIVDPLVLASHAVGHHMVSLARKIQRMAVRKVPTVRQIHAEDHIARLNHGRVSRLIGLRTRVRLHVDIFGAEELLGPLARQGLHRIREFASPVIALTGISLGVLVGEYGAGGLQDRFGSEVFAGDQFQTAMLALNFMLDRCIDFRINGGKRARHALDIVHKF